MEITWKFEQDKLNAAIAERIKVQGRTVRTFAQIVNHALYSVALRAQHYTPKATATLVEGDRGTIDVSMNVTVNFVTTKLGKKVPARKPGKFSYGPGRYREEEISLAKLIVLARADISKQGRATGRSNYNVLTNDRWRLPKDALKGKGTIDAMMYRMTAARHSSSALLKAGWKPAIDTLRPFLSRNQLGGALPAPERFAYNQDSGRLGMAIPAKEGWVCWGRIENNVGGGGSKLDERQRKALFEFGTAPLQRALTEETEEMMAYTRKYLDQDAADFNRETG